MLRGAALVLLGCVALALSLTTRAESVRDDRGRELRVARAPQRVIALAPHLTELVIAAGAASRLIAVDTHSDDPSLPASVRRLAAYPNPDLETLMSLRPDLVLIWAAGLSPAVLARLESLGFALFVSDPRQLHDISATLDRLARLMGETAAPQARQAAAQFREALAQLRARHARDEPVPVFLQVWSQPLISVGSASVLADSLSVCGARSIMADASTAVVRVDPETVMTRAPALIIATRADADGEPWRQLGVLQPTGRIRFLAMDGRLLERASPAMLAPLHALCALVESHRMSLQAVQPRRP